MPAPSSSRVSVCDYTYSVWAYPKELRQLTHKIIDAYLSDNSKKKQGKLRQGYEIAKDPSEWEAEQEKKDAAANVQHDEEEPEEDVDMLADDGGAAGGAGKKRKRTASDKEPKAKKEAAPKAKKEPAPKKRKVRPNTCLEKRRDT